MSSDAGAPLRDPPLFGVVGLERQSGMAGGLGVHDRGGRRRMVMTSRTVTFRAFNGSSITVTSAADCDDGRYESIRLWAPMGPYLATPSGRELLDARSEGSKPLEPIAVAWHQVTIRVADDDVAFEVCELGDGWWAALGRVPGSIITLDSRGVQLDAVRLEEIDEHPVPDFPDLGDETAAVREALDARFAQVPFRRVHNLADYWDLRSIEVDHIERLGHQHSVTDDALQHLEVHWLARVDRELADVIERLRHKGSDTMLNSPFARRLRGRNALFQLWFNTIGPGARCWIGNRYTPVRHRTFRLRWRP